MIPHNIERASYEQVVDPDGTHRIVPALNGVDLDRTIHEAARDAMLGDVELVRLFTRRLAYRPGWTFDADYGPGCPVVRVIWETDDVHGPGTAKLAANIAVDPMRHSLRILAWEILARIRELEDHERLELFRQGADRLFDPHPDGAALGTEAPRPEIRR